MFLWKTLHSSGRPETQPVKGSTSIYAGAAGKVPENTEHISSQHSGPESDGHGIRSRAGDEAGLHRGSVPRLSALRSAALRDLADAGIAQPIRRAGGAVQHEAKLPGPPRCSVASRRHRIRSRGRNAGGPCEPSANGVMRRVRRPCIAQAMGAELAQRRQ